MRISTLAADIYTKSRSKRWPPPNDRVPGAGSRFPALVGGGGGGRVADLRCARSSAALAVTAVRRRLAAWAQIAAKFAIVDFDVCAPPPPPLALYHSSFTNSAVSGFIPAAPNG